MIILFLFTSVIFQSTYSMESAPNSWHLYKELIYNHKNQNFNPHNIELWHNIFPLINSSKNGLLLAKAINACLPQEVIIQYIRPHFSTTVLQEYKHLLINYKFSICALKEQKIKPQNYSWQPFSSHDGRYCMVPQLNLQQPVNQQYASLDEKTCRKNIPFSKNQDYRCQLISCDSNNNHQFSFAIKGKSFAHKELAFDDNNHDDKKEYTSIVYNYLIFKYCLSSDNSLLALGIKKRNYHNIIILNTQTKKHHFYSINGLTNIINTAHHSPQFIIASNATETHQQPNLLLVSHQKGLILHGHGSPITCTQFNDEDTQLLTCSYNTTTETSKLILWNCSNFLTALPLWNKEYSGNTFKTFFINIGKNILTMNTNGCVKFLITSTGDEIREYHYVWNSPVLKNIINVTPLCLLSKKHDLFINTFENNIKIRATNSQKCLATTIMLKTTPIKIGLTSDENTLILIDAHRNVYKLQLYNKQNCSEINFIENKANIIQLYTLLSTFKTKNTFTLQKKYTFINSYIRTQQQQ